MLTRTSSPPNSYFDQKHGAWKRYHPNGQLWDEGRFEHGKKKGTWKVYNEAGELLKTQTFK